MRMKTLFRVLYGAFGVSLFSFFSLLFIFSVEPVSFRTFNKTKQQKKLFPCLTEEVVKVFKWQAQTKKSSDRNTFRSPKLSSFSILQDGFVKLFERKT